MGRLAILPCAYSRMVPVRLDYVICGSGELRRRPNEGRRQSEAQLCLKAIATAVHLSHTQSNYVELMPNFSFFRTDRCRLTSSTLSSAGCSESSLDHISFYVRYSIQQSDGVSERLSSTGEA